MTTEIPTDVNINSNIGSVATITATTFVAVAGVTVVLRLYTKLVYVKKVTYSDAVIIAAWLFSVGLTILIYFDVHYGMGRHMAWFETLGQGAVDEFQNFEKSLYINLLFYYAAVSAPKVSMLLQYVQFFGLAYPKLAKGCWILLWIQVLQAFLVTMVSAFACSPTSAFWTHTRGVPVQCLDWGALLFFNSAFNILMDLLLIVIPVWPIRTLNIIRKQRRILIGIFCLGGIGTIMSILRLKSVYDSTYGTGEATRVEVYIAVWSSVEINVGIMCACLTTLRPLVARLFPKSGLSTADMSSTSGTSTTHADSLPSCELMDVSGKFSSTEEVKDVEMALENHVAPDAEDEPAIERRAQRPDMGRRDTVETVGTVETMNEDYYHRYGVQ